MSDQQEFNRQFAQNRQFYEANRAEIDQYTGQYVGIAFGRLIAVHPDYFHVCRIVDGLEPASLHHLVFHAGDDPGFEPVCTSFNGEFLPWEEPAGMPPPTVGTQSTSVSTASQKC